MLHGGVEVLPPGHACLILLHTSFLLQTQVVVCATFAWEALPTSLGGSHVNMRAQLLVLDHPKGLRYTLHDL